MAKRRRKEIKAKVKKSNAAYIFLFVAVLFLYANSALRVLARNQMALLLQQYGIPATEIMLVTSALIWFILGTLAWITNYKIDKTNDRGQKWMLFILSIVTMITGMVGAGVIMIIAAILYLRQK